MLGVNYYCLNCGCALDNCGNCPNGCYQPEVTSHQLPEVYNYKCPKCNGEFNSPSIKQEETTGTLFIYRCPFCGRAMEGI